VVDWKLVVQVRVTQASLSPCVKSPWHESPKLFLLRVSWVFQMLSTQGTYARVSIYRYYFRIFLPTEIIIVNVKYCEELHTEVHWSSTRWLEIIIFFSITNKKKHSRDIYTYIQYSDTCLYQQVQRLLAWRYVANEQQMGKPTKPAERKFGAFVTPAWATVRRG
jgi:hypothetical protein